MSGSGILVGGPLINDKAEAKTQNTFKLKEKGPRVWPRNNRILTISLRGIPNGDFVVGSGMQGSEVDMCSKFIRA